MEYSISINGIDIIAEFSDEEIGGLYNPPLKKPTDTYKKISRRILVMLAAPPGAGKTTLVSFLEYMSKKEEGIIPIQGIGMDGFHRRQEYLLSHTTLIDGKKVSMVDVKGAPITFDLDRLADKIADVASGKICGWPVYDRLLHNPVVFGPVLEERNRIWN